MYYIVYKITNLINSKIYIGVHKTENLDDGYMGSGTYLKRSIEKHGIDNFKKEIIKVFDNQEDMFNMESELVNEDFVNSITTYNIKLGGNGGWYNYNLNKHQLAARNIKINANRNYSDKKYREKLSKSLIGRKNPNAFNGATFLGHKHTEETKAKIGKANSINQTGSGNSQYGTMWIYNLKLKECKKIKKEEFQSYEENGWLKGRKMKF